MKDVPAVITRSIHSEDDAWAALAAAVYWQAYQDARCADPQISAEAQAWLDGEGRNYLAWLNVDEGYFKRMEANGQSRD